SVIRANFGVGLDDFRRWYCPKISKRWGYYSPTMGLNRLTTPWQNLNNSVILMLFLIVLACLVMSWMLFILFVPPFEIGMMWSTEMFLVVSFSPVKGQISFCCFAFLQSSSSVNFPF